MRVHGLVVVISLAFGSVAAASVAAINGPAHVDRVAQRVAPPFRPDQPVTERIAAEVVELVNDERARRGLPIMRPNELVSAAAVAHAQEMAERRQLVHFGRDGSDAGDRLSREGFVWRTWGEAIGAGFATPQLLFEAWMASDDERAHILSGNTFVGVGVAATPDGMPYWALTVAT